MFEERIAVSKYKSISLPRYLLPKGEARNAEAARWAAEEAESESGRNSAGVEGISPQWEDGLSKDFRDRCKEALDFAAQASAAYGLPFNENAKLALQGLGTGKPAALQITDHGMQMADDFLSKNGGLFHPDEQRSTPELKIGKAKFGFEDAGDGERTIGPQPHPLGALLGEATVMRDASGKVIGISDQFDYDPGNHLGLTAAGMRIVNNRITSDCPNRIPFVRITGGKPIPGER
jgi:hypothetical protein